MTSPTGRRTGLNPALAAPYGTQSYMPRELKNELFAMNYGDLEQRLITMYGLPTAGRYRLTCQIHDEIQYSFRAASGNARQRRRQVRIWRRQGFIVTHYHQL